MDTSWRECKNGDDLEAQPHRVSACPMAPQLEMETNMNTAFRTPDRNPDPVAGQESAAIRATLEGYHRQTIEAMRLHGRLTQK